MVLDRAAYKKALRERTEEWSFWWDVLVGVAASAFGWLARCLYQGQWDMPGILELAVAALVVVALEGSRIVRGRRNAAYEIYRDAALEQERFEKLWKEAIKQLEQRRPRLLLILDERTSDHFVEIGKETVIKIENRGNLDAINVHIDSIRLGDFVAEFPFIYGPIAKDGGSTQITVNLRYADESIVENAGHDLALAIDRATFWNDAKSDSEDTLVTSRTLPITVICQDLEANDWMTTARLVVDRITRRIAINNGVTRSISRTEAKRPEPAA